MLIRSQDKTAVVNVDNVFDIGTRDINGATAICIGSSSSFRNIAEYSTKAKALKVLDMIQEAYAEYEAERIYKEGVFEIEVFQMPEDSEVEA